MRYKTCTSSVLSEMFCIPRERVPQSWFFREASGSGLFLGNALEGNMPCFFNPDLLMNPHVFVCGMTGSGKTYLMKGLMLKLFAVADYSIVVIDFTGEYSELARSAGGIEADPDSIASAVERDRVMLHVDLRAVPTEDARIECADSVLKEIAELMRKSATGKRTRCFVILDEAWKLLRSSASFETILREGRKYGVGLVLGSQLLEDVDAPLLNNVATVFVFRLQDTAALSELSANYGLDSRDMSSVQNLMLGSCMLIQVHKSRQRKAFAIGRVSGIELKRPFMIRFGDAMYIEVDVERFGTLVRNICGGRSPEILLKAQEKGEIQLSDLVRDLLSAGADRRNVLKALRGLGIGDSELADAFSAAVCLIGD